MCPWRSLPLLVRDIRAAPPALERERAVANRCNQFFPCPFHVSSSARVFERTGRKRFTGIG